MSNAKHTPATPLPQLSVQWDESKERVSLITLGSCPHDYVLATSKDSGKGKVYERIAHAANAYPKLVEALRNTLHDRSQHLSRDQVDAILNLLRELGEE